VGTVSNVLNKPDVVSADSIARVQSAIVRLGYVRNDAARRLRGGVSSTVGIAAAARYLSTSEYKGKVALTGLGTPNQMRDFVEDGTVTAFALWNPEDLGYLAAFAAQALITGEITGAEGDTFEAGKLGSYTDGENGSVLLGDPYVFDADNIGDFDF
jgi:rhamnose transport system substrate-binding protein